MSFFCVCVCLCESVCVCVCMCVCVCVVCVCVCVCVCLCVCVCVCVCVCIYVSFFLPRYLYLSMYLPICMSMFFNKSFFVLNHLFTFDNRRCPPTNCDIEIHNRKQMPPNFYYSGINKKKYDDAVRTTSNIKFVCKRCIHGELYLLLSLSISPSLFVSFYNFWLFLSS